MLQQNNQPPRQNFEKTSKNHQKFFSSATGLSKQLDNATIRKRLRLLVTSFCEKN